jgi:hypothetical protein
MESKTGRSRKGEGAQKVSFKIIFRSILIFRKEKHDKLKQGGPKHQFDNVDYLRTRDLILDETEDAIEAGMIYILKYINQKLFRRFRICSSKS